MINGYLIDSNATASPILTDPTARPIFVPASVLLEAYKHTDIPVSVEQSFGCFRSAPERVHILADFGSLSQRELNTTRSPSVADVVDQTTTAKIRQALSAGIGTFHERHLHIIQHIKRRQETIRHGLLNPDTNRLMASSVGGTLLAHLPDHLRQRYRARSRDEWLREPLDDDLVSAAAHTAKREMLAFLDRRGFPKSQRAWFLRSNPFMFRILATAFVRRFVNESGNTLANWQRDPQQPEFTNERIDLDVCALASLFRYTVTNDIKNRVCLRYLHRVMEINRQTLLTPTQIVYAASPARPTHAAADASPAAPWSSVGRARSSPPPLAAPAAPPGCPAPVP